MNILSKKQYHNSLFLILDSFQFFGYNPLDMNELTKELQQSPVIYITRDIERALGIPANTENYFIISNFTNFAKQVSENKKNVLLINEDEQLDTWQLMQHEETKKFIDKIKEPNILVFKSTKKIERICEENKWNLLNPKSELANKIEEKISQVEWLDNLTSLLPPHEIKDCKDIEWKDKPFILQFNRAHTGSGTILIDDENKLSEIKQKFPDRPARITEYIEGPIFTSNNVVTKNKTLVGNISYQITGLDPFTDNKFATIGNDWGLADKILTEGQKKQWTEMVDKIGKKMRADGWRGLFGIDVVVEEKTGKLFLIEINARQPASSTYESQLQSTIEDRRSTINIFEAHLASLLDVDKEVKELKKIDIGAQIILRNMEHGTWNMEQITKLQNLKTIRYENTRPGSELLRIQSNKSIMTNHNEFNDLGEKIKNTLSLKQFNNLTIKQLSVSAIEVINNYLNLPFQKVQIPTPYFNNKRNKVRAGLSVTIGKGSPEDIVNEATIIGLREKKKVNKLPEEELKKFLVDHNLGVDCSGLVYHVLDAELKSIKNKCLKKYLKFPNIKNPLRKILAKMRTAENTNVKVLVDEKNTHSVELKNIQPGDVITILASKKFSNPDHILLVKSIKYKVEKPGLSDSRMGNKLDNIEYVHSYKWNIDGLYNHGVREGVIEILDENKNLIDQKWIEKNESGEKNETKKLAKEAQVVEIRRLNCL